MSIATLSVFFAIAAIGLVLLSGQQSRTVAQLHLATPDEVSLAILARDTGDKDFCDALSPGAVRKWKFNLPGQQIALLRSQCYLQLARDLKDASLCEFVVTLSDSEHDGSYFSKENCKKTTKEAINPYIRGRETLSTVYLEKILSAAGFAFEDLARDCTFALESRVSKWSRQDSKSKTPENFLFGPFEEPELRRPWWYCKFFFAPVADQKGLVLNQISDQSAMRNYRAAMHRIYATKVTSGELLRKKQEIIDELQ